MRWHRHPCQWGDGEGAGGGAGPYMPGTPRHGAECGDPRLLMGPGGALWSVTVHLLSPRLWSLPTTVGGLGELPRTFPHHSVTEGALVAPLVRLTRAWRAAAAGCWPRPLEWAPRPPEPLPGPPVSPAVTR